MKTKRTNIEIDIKKLEEAKKISGLKTTKEVVDFALGSIVGSKNALDEWFKLKGKIHFDKNYDYKRSR